MLFFISLNPKKIMSDNSTNNNATTINKIIDLVAKYYNIFLSLGLLGLAYYLKWNPIILVLFVSSLVLFVPAVKKTVDAKVSDGVKKTIATFMAGVSAIAGFFGLNQEPPKPVNNNINNSSVVVSSVSKSSLTITKLSSSSVITNNSAKIETSKSPESKVNTTNQNVSSDKKTSSMSTQTQSNNQTKSDQPKPKGFIEGSCEELKTKGIVNIKRGDANYTEARDRNNDGVACEG